MHQDLEIGERRAMDHNRTVLRQVVGIVREHLTACHAGEDIDCAGVLSALEDASRVELEILLNTALCQLARRPDLGDVAALAALDFEPVPDVAT